MEGGLHPPPTLPSFPSNGIPLSLSGLNMQSLPGGVGMPMALPVQLSLPVGLNLSNLVMPPPPMQQIVIPMSVPIPKASHLMIPDPRHPGIHLPLQLSMQHQIQLPPQKKRQLDEVPSSSSSCSGGDSKRSRGRPKGPVNPTGNPENRFPCICGKRYVSFKGRQAHRRQSSVIGGGCGDAFLDPSTGDLLPAVGKAGGTVEERKGKGFHCTCGKSFQSSSGLYGHRFKNKAKCNVSPSELLGPVPATHSAPRVANPLSTLNNSSQIQRQGLGQSSVSISDDLFINPKPFRPPVGVGGMGSGPLGPHVMIPSPSLGSINTVIVTMGAPVGNLNIGNGMIDHALQGMGTCDNDFPDGFGCLEEETESEEDDEDDDDDDDDDEVEEDELVYDFRRDD